ncbi:MAG TPA: malate synthase G, partial [Streptosporangiaceae bacterium]|nr:malate synthase G [Streptosporangiaceae bacterium]
MTRRVQAGGLSVAEELYRFVMDEALPGAGVDPGAFWEGAGSLVQEFAPRNRELIARRAELQKAIDEYHLSSPGHGADHDAYAEFLTSIGYLVDEPGPFGITTSGVDQEITVQAGPQLVVPLLNARFATNAANARWGSLYDALYGTDVIDEADGRERGGAYNPVRGAAVIARARAFLDEHFPLDAGSHAEASAYSVDDKGLVVVVAGESRRLADAAAFAGYQGAAASPEAVLLVHHGLHVEVQIDREDPIGAADPAGVKDVVLEAAVTTIMDLEDSVAAVDAADKVLGYRNWLRLMQGRLAEEVTKNGRTFTRVLNPDRTYLTTDGTALTLPGRALLFVRQVGLLMTTDAVLDGDGQEVPEGIVDALVCGLGSLHDLRGGSGLRNSRAGSIYVVMPKLHGPDEVAFACAVFARVEHILGLPARTIKVGIMDEERRTSANLKACVHAARDRVAFINTGFLDRTGDEIHTSMHAGPMVPKPDMRSQRWIRAYEDNNVDVGLACGFSGRAQIGKGMWAAPDNLAEMLDQKITHPQAGASCAWVPSPTAATLHALHYHQVDVLARQRELAGRARAGRADLLTIPLGDPGELSAAEVQAELENNLQGVLGYVVRWVNAGVGCSKVPDIHGTPLMEDRATCRISSQHVANWLRHGVITADQVDDALRHMAAVVDGQNAGDPSYLPMGPSFDGPAFAAARALVFDGLDQPSGYTEPILHGHRRA